jgi:hypothetical protein
MKLWLSEGGPPYPPISVHQSRCVRYSTWLSRRTCPSSVIQPMRVVRLPEIIWLTSLMRLTSAPDSRETCQAFLVILPRVDARAVLLSVESAIICNSPYAAKQAGLGYYRSIWGRATENSADSEPFPIEKLSLVNTGNWAGSIGRAPGSSISLAFISGPGNENFIILLFSKKSNRATVASPCESDAALGCEHRGPSGVPVRPWAHKPRRDSR